MILLLLLACVPTVVHFECDSGAPFCDTLAVVQDERPLATGVSITGIATYAGVERVFFDDGEDVDDPVVSLIAHRDLMVRVLVAPSDDFSARTLTARVYLHRDGDLVAAFQEDLEVSAASDWTQLESSFNLDINGSLLEGELAMSVEIVEASADAGGSEAELSPSWGPRDLEFMDVGQTLRVVVVPIEYNADGSGRLPDTSDEQIEIYRQYMQWMYPVPTVEMSVGKQMSTEQSVGASGTGWSELLNELTGKRAEQGVGDDVYLFGAFNPTEDWGSFCNSGCVAGLSNQALTAGDSYSRASIGLGFYGSSSALTMAHEVGHAAGRNHSPGCGAAGADENYPNDDGLLDYRGYDPIDGWLQETDTTYDIMSYCSPYGVSAFTTEALATRIAEVNDLYKTPKDRVARQTYLSVSQNADGQVQWGPDRPIVGPLVGEARPLELFDAAGKSLGVVESTFAGFADLAGGVYVFADPGVAVSQVRVDGVLSNERRQR